MAKRNTPQLPKVIMLHIDRYDWQFPHTICYRLQPILRPKSFRHSIQAIAHPAPPALGITGRDRKPASNGTCIVWPMLLGKVN